MIILSTITEAKLMQTENFSNLPKSWQVKTLGECLDYEQPTKYIVKSTKYNDSYKTPVLTAGKSFILGYTDESEGIFTQTPVIIFDDFTTDTKFVDFKFKVKSSAMKILHPKENADIKFLYYLMQTIRHRSDTHKRYWISEYAKIKIPLPPLEIQKRIVARLDEAFARIDNGTKHLKSAQNNLTKYKQSLLKSAFNGTLTDTLPHPKPLPQGEGLTFDSPSLAEDNFTRSPSLAKSHISCPPSLAEGARGWVDSHNSETPNPPQGWTIKTLGEIGEIVSGGTPSTTQADNFGGNIAWITPADLSNHNDKFISQGKRNISKKGLKSSSARLVPKGTILFSSRAPIGYVAIASNSLCTNQGFKSLIPKENVFSEFVYYYLLNAKSLAESYASGTTFKEISAKSFSKLPIPLPPLQTQKQIVEILEKHFSSADKTGAFIDSALKNAKQLKSSLLKSAFAGKLI